MFFFYPERKKSVFINLFSGDIRINVLPLKKRSNGERMQVGAGNFLNISQARERLLETDR